MLSFKFTMEKKNNEILAKLIICTPAQHIMTLYEKWSLCAFWKGTSIHISGYILKTYNFIVILGKFSSEKRLVFYKQHYLPPPADSRKHANVLDLRPELNTVKLVQTTSTSRHPLPLKAIPYRNSPWLNDHLLEPTKENEILSRLTVNGPSFKSHLDALFMRKGTIK